MSTSTRVNVKDADSRIASQTKNRPRYSKDDALDDREFELLLQGASAIEDDYYRQQARFIILVCGRLGMRVGELTHITEDWIDWRNRFIVIPHHEPCNHGRDGGPCGACRQYARQRVDHNADLDLETALSHAWRPKTEAAARKIPFDHDPRVELEIEGFFDRWECFRWSSSAVDRRLKRAQENAPQLASKNIYAHCLRASAASFHASRGLGAITLQSLMGWATLNTSMRYVRSSGEATARALRAAHNG